MNLNEAKALYIKAKDAYYNSGKTIITDAQYDKLEDWIKSKDPSWPELQKTGIRTDKLGKKQEVRLPFFMPSLNKFYPEEVDKLWNKFAKEQNKFVYMYKLDGCSVLIKYENCQATQLITRGNGTFGKDISFLLPALNLPKINSAETLYLRSEAIISKKMFAEKWSEEFDNARNMVSGLLNRTAAHPAMKDIEFLILGIFGQPLLNGLQKARKLGLKTVTFFVMQAHHEVDVYREAKDSAYEADGVVISVPDFTYEYEDADKPKAKIFAYKENSAENEVEATVEKIVWQSSVYGRLIPKIQVKPVQLGGVTVTYATCHNAAWAKEKNIGPGTIVRLIRSGDVIPKIVGVVNSTTFQAPSCDYKIEGVHFIQTVESDETYLKAIVRIFATFDIDGVKIGTVKTLYEQYNNYFAVAEPVDAIFAILEDRPMLQQELVGTFGPKSGLDVYNALKSVKEDAHTVIDWLIATRCMDAGAGQRRLRAIQDVYNNLMCFNKPDETVATIAYQISIVKGFSDKTARLIAEGLVKFFDWYNKNQASVKLAQPEDEEEIVDGVMSGINVTFTGYRDQSQEKAIKDLGGQVINFGAKTTWLLYKPDGKRSTKIAKAGDKAITWAELVQKYPQLPADPTLTNSLF